MASTTVTIPGGVQLWIEASGGGELVPSSPGPSPATLKEPPGFVLYLPITAESERSVINGASALNLLPTGHNINPIAIPEGLGFILSGGRDTQLIQSWTATEDLSTSITLSAQETLYVAYTAALPKTVDASTLLETLQKALATSGPTVVAATTVLTTLGGTQSSAVSTSSSTSSNSAETDSKSNVRAIAGGVVGGVVGLAIIIAATIWFIARRKKNQMQEPLPEMQKYAVEGSS